jgi:hypothetical protein
MPYGSGTHARRSDTKLMLLVKLVTTQGAGGINAPHRNDTIRKAKLKFERIVASKTNPA